MVVNFHVFFKKDLILGFINELESLGFSGKILIICLGN